MIYKLTSLASLIFRAVLCYLTIEAVPLIDDVAIEWLVGQAISLYALMRIATYSTVRAIGYRKNRAPLIGVLLYFIIYVALTLVTWGILSLLTYLNILPISI